MTGYGVMTQRWGWQPTARMLGGLPTWAWRCAPPGLLTRRQMRAAGLAPGGAEPVAQVICKRGRRKAYLYDPAELVPKRTPSPAQLQAVAKATKARRWCPTGAHYADYCIPTSLGECVECHYSDTGIGGEEDAAEWDQEQAQELGGRPVELLAVSGQEPGVGGRCRTAVARAQAALDRLHEQCHTQQGRWAPVQGGTESVGRWLRVVPDQSPTELTEALT